MTRRPTTDTPRPADAIRLRTVLAAAIAALPLGLAPACSAPQPVDPPPETAATTTASTETVSNPPFIVHNDENCATQGEWAMTIGAARHRSEQAGMGYSPGATGCPNGFETVAPAHEAMRRAGGRTLSLYLDEYATMEAREAGAVDLCVYQFNDVCFEEYDHPVVGRLLAGDDAAGVTAPVATASDDTHWFDASLAASLDGWSLPVSPLQRRRIGSGWLRDAGYEHASVASFHRAALELMVHGAPPAILEGCSGAAADEVRHARACFTLASHYLGERQTPTGFAPPAPRPRTLAELAADTLREGAIGETVAILAATRQLRWCTVAPVRGVLETILADETRHAALAWATVGWALAEERAGRAPGVRAAVEATLAEAEATLAEAGARGADDARSLAGDGLAEHGRLPTEGGGAVLRDALATIVRPLLDDLLAASAAS